MTDFGPARRLAIGAVGEPGQRAFYLQVETDAGSTWFALEKQQAAALAARAGELLDTVGFSEPDPAVDATLDEPVAVEFRIGEMAIGFAAGVFTLTFQPIGEGDARVEVSATPAQVDALARTALVSVQAGRPRCPHCGLAVDPSGHACPEGNGDLRAHRP